MLNETPSEAPASTCHLKPAQCSMKHEKHNAPTIATEQKQSTLGAPSQCQMQNDQRSMLNQTPSEPPPATCHLKPAQCSMKHEKPDADSSGSNEKESNPAEQTQSHTARRWLSYTPRRPCDPEPDNSWIHECPCGQKLPCTPHGNLWRELR